MWRMVWRSVVFALLVLCACKRDEVIVERAPPKISMPVLVSFELGGTYLENSAIDACKAWNIRKSSRECIWSGVRMDHDSEAAFWESRTSQDESIMIVTGSGSCSADDCFAGIKTISVGGKRIRSILYIPHDTPGPSIKDVIEDGIRRALNE